MSLKNTWPGGVKHKMTQQEHIKWNECNYPGTRMLCSKCEVPTETCEEDTIYDNDGHPLCYECFGRVRK